VCARAHAADNTRRAAADMDLAGTAETPTNGPKARRRKRGRGPAGLAVSVDSALRDASGCVAVPARVACCLAGTGGGCRHRAGSRRVMFDDAECTSRKHERIGREMKKAFTTSSLLGSMGRHGEPTKVNGSRDCKGQSWDLSQSTREPARQGAGRRSYHTVTYDRKG
jgi:hypothetical protein